MSVKTQVPVNPLMVPPPTEFTFDCTTSASNAQRWTAWFRRFERYLRSTQLTDDAQKIDLLLYIAGPAVEEVYLAKAKANDAYKDVVTVLEEYFLLSKNTDAEVMKFREAKQRSGEGVKSFVVRLRTLAATCEFKNDEENQIRHQLMQGCLDKRVYAKGFKEATSLDELIKFAVALETKVARPDERPEPEAQVHQVRQEARWKDRRAAGGWSSQKRAFGGSKPREERERARSDRASCWNCGKEFPHREKCPADGKRCSECGIEGHFARCCPRRGGRARLPKAKARAHQVTARKTVPMRRMSRADPFSPHLRSPETLMAALEQR